MSKQYDPQPRKTTKNDLPPFWIVGLSAFGLWVVFGFLPYLFRWLNWTLDDPDKLGAAAGYAASLFSGLAFAGVIYAIFLQRHELHLQREELKLSGREMKLARQEAERSADALNQQVDIAKKTAMLNSLLAMADFHSRRMELTTDAATSEGFRYVADDCLSRARSILADLGAPIGAMSITSRNSEAANELQKILDYLSDCSHVFKDFDDVARPLGIFGQIAEDLNRWLKEHPHSPSNNLVKMLLDQTTAASRHGKKARCRQIYGRRLWKT